tara:strand:+ start:126 stop:623 length:498 start_codon:yes stop_codon:yes gene_type:complete
MSIKFLILLLTGLLIYDTYYDNYYIKLFKTYKKYYKMIGIFIVGLGLFKVVHSKQQHETADVLNNFIKVLPIDKTSNLLPPSIPNPIKNVSLGEQRIHKRSVGETKKKFVASQQNWKCGDCQDQLSAWFEVDHKQRLDRGGTNELNNLVALCRNCHGKKTALENM